MEKTLNNKKGISKTQATKPQTESPSSISSNDSVSEPFTENDIAPQPPVKKPLDKKGKKRTPKNPTGIKAWLLNFVNRKIKQYSKF